MVKSGAPVFVVLFAFAFRLEKPTLAMFGTISIIVIGILITVLSEQKEVHFDMGGYIQVQLATFFSGFRWALTQILLQRESMGMTHPVVTTIYIAPPVALTIFIAFGLLEGLGPLLNSHFFATPAATLHILGITLIGGLLAFGMSLAEFFLISHTSVVTFTVCGILKEILAIATAAIVFHDNITTGKIIGLVISVGGIALYNYIKFWQLRGRRDIRNMDGRTESLQDILRYEKQGSDEVIALDEFWPKDEIPGHPPPSGGPSRP